VPWAFSGHARWDRSVFDQNVLLAGKGNEHTSSCLGIDVTGQRGLASAHRRPLLRACGQDFIFSRALFRTP
jgi:hypothetical protein